MIAVAAVRDFGIEAISPSAARYFAQHMDDALPGVNPAVWAANRHVPLEEEMLGLLAPLSHESARAWIVAQDDESTLYTTSTKPTLTFSGNALTASLRNLPPNTVIEDFVLDLSNVLFHAVRATSFHK